MNYGNVVWRGISAPAATLYARRGTAGDHQDACSNAWNVVSLVFATADLCLLLLQAVPPDKELRTSVRLSKFHKFGAQGQQRSPRQWCGGSCLAASNMTIPRAPSRNPTSTSIHSNNPNASQVANNNAAVLGAATAFVRLPSAQRIEKANTGSVVSSKGSGDGILPNHQRDGVLSQARSRALSPMPGMIPLQRSRTESSSRSDTIASSEKTFNLSVPQRPEHFRSPSAHAAALATARAPSPSTPKPSSTKQVQARPRVAPKPRRLSDKSRDSLHLAGGGKRTDPTPIAPTTSLVDLFERKADSTNPSNNHGRPDLIVVKPSPELSIRSPKPVRAEGGITSMFQMELAKVESESNASSNSVSQHAFSNPRHVTESKDALLSDTENYASASEDFNDTSSPPQSASRRTDSAAPSTSTSPIDLMKSRSGVVQQRSRPSPSPVRRTTTQPIEIQPLKRAETSLSPASPAHSLSYRSIPAQINSAYPKRMTPLTTGDELANALVASSLASSRAPSPRKDLAPPIPTRRRKNHHKIPGFPRTPSPIKTGMLHTLRGNNDECESEDDAADSQHPYHKHQRKRIVRKHPNKHHEGDRKRWRDALTERERKRYEGVWAANKGLYVDSTAKPTQTQAYGSTLDIPANVTGTEESSGTPRPSLTLSRVTSNTPFAAGSAPDQEVSSIVARDIWLRSRLPLSVLETVWDLVDHDCIGRLSKEEFVVGMWLIDQRLRGRKLPVKVTESVWASVRRIEGIKVKQMK